MDTELREFLMIFGALLITDLALLLILFWAVIPMEKKILIRCAIPVGVVLSIQGFHALRSPGFGIEGAQAVCGAIKTAPFRKVVLQRSFPQLKDMPAGRVEDIAENSMKAELKKCPVVMSAVGERMDLNF